MPRPVQRKLVYQTGEPTEVGVYACRVPFAGLAGHLHEDVFLMWLDGCWNYVTSDQTYRGKVFGWIGPLPRTRSLP